MRYSLLTIILVVATSFTQHSHAQRTPDAALINAQLALQKDPMAVRIAPELLLLHDVYQAHRAEGKGTFVSPVASATVRDEMVRIEAVSTESTATSLIAELRAIGLTDPTSFRHALNGWLPISAIRQMGSLEHLRFVHQAYRPIYGSGIVTSQGDTAQNSHLARMNFSDAMGMPIDGSGIRVCVVSDSYDDKGGAADDIASGDLPAEGVINLDSTLNGNRSDEGRAMLQIVHDVAPGAELMFHTADGGIPTLAAHIMQLADSGCTVIVDDVVYPNDAMFMDGLVAQAADEVALAGITYLTAAGNAGRRSYQSAYRPAGSDTTINFETYRPHDFDPGPGEDIYQTIKVKPGATLRLSLNWDDPWYSITGGAATDTDVNIFLYKEMTGSPQTPLAVGNIVNNNPPSGNGPWGNAWEVITWQNTLGTLDSMFNIFIGWVVDFGGPQP
ncbi:MAG: hypothetical protein R3330_13620, partial [Saprospiraceae bacterium]|nr:hypothetical protein [Saprospiraceae bacterium]